MSAPLNSRLGWCEDPHLSACPRAARRQGRSNLAGVGFQRWQGEGGRTGKWKGGPVDQLGKGGGAWIQHLCRILTPIPGQAGLS